MRDKRQLFYFKHGGRFSRKARVPSIMLGGTIEAHERERIARLKDNGGFVVHAGYIKHGSVTLNSSASDSLHPLYSRKSLVPICARKDPRAPCV